MTEPCRYIFDWNDPAKDCSLEFRHEGAHMEGKVEAGDRALEVLAEIMEMAPIRHTLGLNHTYESRCRCLRCKADSAIEVNTSKGGAGDRALETARKLCGGGDNKIFVYGGLPETFGSTYGWATAEQIAALIQSAMNAQERELREALRTAKVRLEICLGRMRACHMMDSKQHEVSLEEIPAWIAEAERLLAERGEGR